MPSFLKTAIEAVFNALTSTILSPIFANALNFFPPGDPRWWIVVVCMVVVIVAGNYAIARVFSRVRSNRSKETPHDLSVDDSTALENTPRVVIPSLPSEIIDELKSVTSASANVRYAVESTYVGKLLESTFTIWSTNRYGDSESIFVNAKGQPLCCHFRDNRAVAVLGMALEDDVISVRGVIKEVDIHDGVYLTDCELTSDGLTRPG